MGVDYYTCLVCNKPTHSDDIGKLFVYQNKDDYAKKNDNYVEIGRVCVFLY